MFRWKKYYVSIACFCLMGCLVGCGGGNVSQETINIGKGDLVGQSCDPKAPKACAEDNNLVCVAQSINESGTCQVFNPEANMVLGAGYMCSGLSFASCAEGLICEMAKVSPDITDVGGTCVMPQEGNDCNPKLNKACGEDLELVCNADSIDTRGKCVKFEWSTPMAVGAGYPCGGELAATKRCAKGLECKYPTDLPPNIVDVGGVCTLIQTDKTAQCEELNIQYEAAVLKAVACNESAPECVVQESLPSELKCPLPSGAIVNATAALDTLKSLQQQWNQLECGLLSWDCPAYSSIPEWMKIVGECNLSYSKCQPKVVDK